MKISPALSHKLALGAAAIVVVGATYFILNSQGDAATGIDPGTMNSGLGGFGDLLKKLLGNTGGASGLPTGTGNNNLPLPPIGQQGTDLGTDINSTAPDPNGATTDYVQQFKQSLANFFTPATTIAQGPTAGAALSTAVNGQGGFNYAPDTVATTGGMSFLPGGSEITPAGLNTYTVTPNADDFTYPDGSPMTRETSIGTVYNGPTGYNDIPGEQVYAAQYGDAPSNTVYRDILPAGSGGPSNALAYVPSNVVVYQSTPNGLQLVAGGTQLPAPSQNITEFQGYGLTYLAPDTPLYMNDTSSPTAGANAYVLTPLANSNSPDNWVGSQGHNPNNPYDTN